MSEKSDNSESVDSGQQFAAADMIAELLDYSTPHQRALLSVLAVSYCHDVDPVPLISGLAEELPSSDRTRAGIG